MAAIIERLQDVGTATKAKGMDLLDRQIPPQQRSELTANLRRFASQNPKLAVRQITSIAAKLQYLLLISLHTGIHSHPPRPDRRSPPCLHHLLAQRPCLVPRYLPPHRSLHRPLLLSILRRCCTSRPPSNRLFLYRYRKSSFLSGCYCLLYPPTIERTPSEAASKRCAWEATERPYRRQTRTFGGAKRETRASIGGYPR